MTEVDIPEQFRQLRAAALAVLDQAGASADHPEPLRTALTELHRIAISGASTDPADSTSRADPTRHLMSMYRYEGTEKFPITLDQEAEDIRRELAGDRTVGSHSPSATEHNVVLTELRGMIIGGLLQELASRLSPGAAFGLSPAGQKLATVVTDLAQELLDQTFVGRQ